MAPSALLPEYSPAPEIAAPKTKHQDFRASLFENGYVVIPNAIPKDRAISYQEAACSWLKSFNNPALSFTDPSTWIKSNLPIHSKINTFTTYGIAHEKFMWDVKLEPAVIEAFAKVWGTDELLVSFDALNVTLPNRKDVPKKMPWEHVDQSPFRRGMHCVQGIVNLSPSGPEDGGLVVYPGSHKYLDEFLDTQSDKSAWTDRDFFMFSKEDQKWFADKGVTPHKVCANVGDLILWDSRTMHYGSEPMESSTQIRTVIYVAYTPARLASEESLRKKQEVFRSWGATTHWPHENIVVRDTRALFEDGTRDPRDREEPLEKPELTDRLLKLAGMMPY